MSLFTAILPFNDRASVRCQCRRKLRGYRNGSLQKRTRRAGVACIEFAFIAPFIFFLIFGAIEFSRIVMVKQALTNAAREGSREAALVNTTSCDAVENAVRESLKGSIAAYTDDKCVRVIISPSTMAGLERGTPITTSIEVDCNDISWLPAMLFVDSVIQTSSTMRRE